MKDVYSNAEVGLAATRSWNSSESLFAIQDPLAMAQCLVGVQGRTSRLGIDDRSFGGIYAGPSTRYLEEAGEASFLSRQRSHAWCFQEIELAKKVISFGDYQV